MRNFFSLSFLLVMALLFTACPNPQTGNGADSNFSDCLTEAAGPFDPMCTLIRYVETADAEGIALIDICTDKDTNNVLDISEKGEQPIMVVYDILCAFPSEEEAQRFAEANGIFDAKYKMES